MEPNNKPDNLLVIDPADPENVLKADAEARVNAPIILSRLDLLSMLRGQKDKGKVYRLANLGRLKADFWTPKGQPYYLASRIPEIDAIMQMQEAKQ